METPLRQSSAESPQAHLGWEKTHELHTNKNKIKTVVGLLRAGFLLLSRGIE